MGCTDMDIYETKKINDNLYAIKEDISDNKFPIIIYLVIGTKRAALIDTGLGTGNLRKIVESITQLPILVLHTHGHGDHIGADALFDEIYLNDKEVGISGNGYPEDISKEEKLKFIEQLLQDNTNLYEQIKGNIVENIKTDYININDGDIIDLGELQLEAIATPGHTRGSLSYVNRRDHYAFTGDGIADIHWFDNDLISLEEFLHTLNYFDEKATNVENIYAAHLPEAFHLQLVHDLQESAKDILEGSNDNIENADYQFLKHGDLYVHRIGGATVYYRKENIYASK